MTDKKKYTHVTVCHGEPLVGQLNIYGVEEEICPECGNQSVTVPWEVYAWKDSVIHYPKSA